MVFLVDNAAKAVPSRCCRSEEVSSSNSWGQWLHQHHETGQVCTCTISYLWVEVGRPNLILVPKRLLGASHIGRLGTGSEPLPGTQWGSSVLLKRTWIHMRLPAEWNCQPRPRPVIFNDAARSQFERLFQNLQVVPRKQHLWNVCKMCWLNFWNRFLQSTQEKPRHLLGHVMASCTQATHWRRRDPSEWSRYSRKWHY